MYDFCYASFQVLTAACIDTAVFLFAGTCSLAEAHRRFRGHFCLPYETLMMVAERTSETYVNVYQNIRSNDPENSIFIFVTSGTFHTAYLRSMPFRTNARLCKF